MFYPLYRETADFNTEKDEDTDGISIISDSEPESSTPCEMIPDKSIIEESRPTELTPPKFISFSPLPPNSNNHEESISVDDFVIENTGKHKTYVHRRNKRLSTVLNIIMLGSVITAAGVAIGHMWGARNECSIHTTPSINKILSNLYKLQEENTYLRNKLKELTLVNSLQMQQRKANIAEKIPFKQQRCKKIYEEPLDSKNTDRITKCIDNDFNNVAEKNFHSHLVQPEYEKEFIRDVDKLKHIYQQNRSWLDDEVAKRLKHEEETLKKIVKSPLSIITEEQKVLQDENIKTQTEAESNQPEANISPDAEQLILLELDENNNDKEKPVQKISYADSLKSEQQHHNIHKRDANTILEKEHKSMIVKKRAKKDKDMTFHDVNFSEEELKKDDRYIGHKHKQEKKKRDRQKLHKKQKRRNKYEQWEMKGGYMKDYEDFSITSFQENDNVFKKGDGNIDLVKTHYINQFPEAESTQNLNIINKPNETQNSKKFDKPVGKNSKGENSNWYDKRAALRSEARKRLEHEMFGETSPNNAGWYFRRMQKREQCRAKSDNSTYKKLSKRNMNFKTKH